MKINYSEAFTWAWGQSQSLAIPDLDQAVRDVVDGWEEKMGDASPTSDFFSAMILWMRTFKNTSPEGCLLRMRGDEPVLGDAEFDRTAGAKNLVVTPEQAITAACLCKWGIEPSFIENALNKAFKG